MIDLTKLEKVRELPGGRIIARCPACAEVDRDHNGQHLTVWPDDHYACAANQGDHEHLRRINALVGIATGERARPIWTPRPTPVIARSTEKPLPRLSPRQNFVMIKAIENLARNDSEAVRRCASIADSRGWKPETVRLTALDQCAGWMRFSTKIRKPDPMCPDEAWCFIYRAGVKVRFHLPDGSKTFRWLKAEGLNHQCLWRFECIGQKTETVWTTEGEPDAIRLMDMGIGETCGNKEAVCALPSASYSLRQDELAALRGKQVIFCPDNDGAGEKAAARLSQSLATVGVKLQIRPVS